MREASMSEINILAIDLAKNSVLVCGVRSDGVVVFKQAVSRGRLPGYALPSFAGVPQCLADPWPQAGWGAVAQKTVWTKDQPA